MEIRINFDGANAVVTVQKENLAVRLDKIKQHEEITRRIFEYGLQRLVNDTANRGGKEMTAAQKKDAAEAFIRELEDGNVRARVAAQPADPVRDMARKTAKLFLTDVFKRRTGLAKIQEMCEADDKVAAYFTMTNDRFVWADGKVDEFMEKHREKRDFMAEAESSLKAADDLDL